MPPKTKKASKANITDKLAKKKNITDKGNCRINQHLREGKGKEDTQKHISSGSREASA